MTLPPRVSAIVFDCDGLLLDTESCWSRAEASLFADYGFGFGPLEKVDQWCAQYPGLPWHVTAASEQAAADEITKEALRRLDAGQDYAQPPRDLLKRHLAKPIPGLYALDRELFLYLRGHAGHAETQRAFEEAERRRAKTAPTPKTTTSSSSQDTTTKCAASQERILHR